MGIGALNSSFQKNGYVSEDMERVWDEKSLINRIFQVEAEMAKVQAELGIIPREAADLILENAEPNEELLLKAGKGGVGNPLVAVLDALREVIPEKARGWVHFGATTQDILDTARALQIKEASALLQSRLDNLVKITADNAHEYAYTMMVARTNGQYALPTTLGTRFARWNAELRRSRARLQEMRSRTEQIQFTGAVGTFASLGEQGPELNKRLAKRLDLVEQTISWHASSDTIMELALNVAVLGQSLAKIAEDLFAMQGSDLVEVREEMDAHLSGSSTMPQKLNPFTTMKISVAARLASGMAATLLTQPPATFERDHRQSEVHRDLIPQIFVAVDGAAAKLNFLFDRLIFDTDKLKAGIRKGGPVLMSEGIMMALAPHIGHGTAHDILQEFAKEYREKRMTLSEFCRTRPQLAALEGKLDLDALTDPQNYLGRAVEISESARD